MLQPPPHTPKIYSQTISPSFPTSSSSSSSSIFHFFIHSCHREDSINTHKHTLQISISAMFNTPFVLLFALLLTLPLVILFAPRVLPPRRLTISIPDELDDVTLFRRAGRFTAHRTGSVSRLGATNAKPKIAFMFLTNTDLHFAPIWEKFFNPPKSNHRKLNDIRNLYNIYIHADPDSDVKPPGGVFENRFIPAKKTQRSSPTLISAARRLIATALLEDPLNAYFALVSQSCIPLHSFRYVYKTLFPPQTASTRSTRGFPSRLSFIEVLSDEPQLYDRYIARGENAMLPEVPFEKFRIGSQFYILTRSHALTVVNDRKLWRKFRLPCLNVDSCYPEEHYFPTLLSMEDPRGLSAYTLTNVNWTGSVGGHPYVYGPAEVSPELIRRLRVSNSSYSYLFGRKFSPECLMPLMEMAEKVIFRG